MTKYPFHVSDKSITVLVPQTGVTHTIREGTKSFLEVRKALLNGDYDKAISLISVKESIEKASDFTVKGGEVFFEGVCLNPVISQKLISIITNGGANCEPVKNYVKRILANPSMQSANELYDFLGYRELPITPEGMVLGYRGVRADMWSKSGNTKTVVLQGKVDAGGHIYNGIGETIEVKRVCVDDDRTRECSHGLHVGSYDYAKSWGERVVLVEFDPADAVSVPKDCEFQKLRVCKFKVIAEVTGKKPIEEPVIETERIKEIVKGEVEGDESLDETVKNVIESYLFDPIFDVGSIINVVQARLPNVSWADAAEAIEAYRGQTVPAANVSMDKALVDKAVAYIEKNGSASVRRIHSALTKKGLTCEQIDKALSKNKNVKRVFFDVEHPSRNVYSC